MSRIRNRAPIVTDTAPTPPLEPETMPALPPAEPDVVLVPAVEGDDVESDAAPTASDLPAAPAEDPPAKDKVIEDGTALMQAAPVNSKVLVLEDGAYFATPKGVAKLPADDHLFDLFPVGVWFRRTGPEEFTGFLPAGAARDVREQTHRAATMSRLVREMSAAITGA
jgi:hypothetical protein